MTTLLLRAAVFLGSAALGLVVADLVVPGFTIVWADWWGFVLCIVIFAVLQSALAPVITRVAQRHAPPLLGGVGIISTLVALLIVVLLPVGGLRIGDALAWVLAPVVVWVVTALATVLLPKLFGRRGAGARGEASRA